MAQPTIVEERAMVRKVMAELRKQAEILARIDTNLTSLIDSQSTIGDINVPPGQLDKIIQKYGS